MASVVLVANELQTDGWLSQHQLGFLLQVAIEPANAYQRTKFQLSSSISFGDMRRSQNKKMGAPDSPRRPLADKFLCRTLVRVNAYQCAKFQRPSSISY